MSDREKALEWFKKKESAVIMPGARSMYREAIKALSEPKRKTGHWVDAVLPNDNGGLPVQVCDQCNTFYPLAYTGGGHRYCPNCGADMRGDKHEAD